MSSSSLSSNEIAWQKPYYSNLLKSTSKYLTNVLMNYPRLTTCPQTILQENRLILKQGCESSVLVNYPGSTACRIFTLSTGEVVQQVLILQTCSTFFHKFTTKCGSQTCKLKTQKKVSFCNLFCQLCSIFNTMTITPLSPLEPPPTKCF